jgi:indolepyruvate ferredoxin oxidoreductase
MTVTKRKESLWSRWPGRATTDTSSGAPASFTDPTGDMPVPVRIVPDDDFSMRITGIGGTGVVTVAQVIGTAAMLDGYQVRGLDQIGLSQKAGPVVSDLRLSRSEPTSTNRLGEAQADLLLAFDQLVAASERGLRTADPDKTTVVGSTTATPTGEMITHLDVDLPTSDALIKRIAERSRSQGQFWVDAAAVTEDLFGSAMSANLFVVGMAVQAGCLPVTPETIEEAIALNEVSVEANMAAFRWGRAQIAMPDTVDAVRGAGRSTSVQRSVGDRVQNSSGATQRVQAMGLSGSRQTRIMHLASELRLWGSEADLRRYLEVIERVASAEERMQSGSRRLSYPVAVHLFKLMAYKDEYEVARLMIHPDGVKTAHEIAGTHDRIAWKLHPPLLRAIGLSRKITIGTWATPAIRLLARAKFLRGTPFDVFGYAKIRRLERALPTEYIAAIEALLARLQPENLDAVVAVAELPDQVRGYEHLKIERIAAYRAELDRATASVSDSRA